VKLPWLGKGKEESTLCKGGERKTPIEEQTKQKASRLMETGGEDSFDGGWAMMRGFDAPPWEIE